MTDDRAIDRSAADGSAALDDGASESEIRNAILGAISKRYHPHGLFYRRNVGSGKSQKGHFVRFGLPGQADIAGCLYGKFIEIEVKAARGRQSDFQKKWQAAVEKAGGIYILASSVDGVIEVLDRIVREYSAV